MAKLISEIVMKTALKSNATLGVRFISNEATFPTKPYKLHLMDDAPAAQVTLKRDDALLMWRQMNTIRRLEAAANALYREKAVRGFCHLYNGQEAVAVGIESSLKKTDGLITSYRDHGWTYLRGTPVEKVLCELTGRRSGVSRGKGGSMHMYLHNFFGGNGIVGAQVPLAAGVAFAKKYLGTDNVCLGLYGDGASNQGQIFEAYNMAKLWSLPCIFVCENNGYGMGTSAKRSTANTDYYTRGDSIPGLWADGMDVLTVREAMRHLVQKSREGKGPFVFEAVTYRYSGHSMSDPDTTYRTRDEIQEVRHTRDCISHFKENILNGDLATEKELADIEHDVRHQIEEGVKLAKSDKEIGLEELYADVYIEPIVEDIRGLTPWQIGKHLRINQPINTY